MLVLQGKNNSLKSEFTEAGLLCVLKTGTAESVHFSQWLLIFEKKAAKLEC
jgi:hypothetical protein